MIENAKRQLLFVLAVVIAAVGLLVYKPLKLGPDLRGGTELIYEVDFDLAKQANPELDIESETARAAIMRETVTIVGERIDPTGVLEAVVVPRGKTGILVELPAMDKTELDSVASRVSELGRLEMRLVADPEYIPVNENEEEDVEFDLRDAAQKLEAWINEGNNRAMLMEDPLKIRQFAMPSEGKNRWLRWYPQKIEPDISNNEFWDSAAARAQSDPSIVTVFTDEQFNGGVVPEGAPPFLVAYFPINMHAEHFTGSDLNAGGVRATVDDSGKPALAYQLNNARAPHYAEWSERNIKKRSAIILNEFVESAPEFQDRIPGSGIIRGSFKEAEVAELGKVLKTGSLTVKPIETSRRTIGASLGDRAVALGEISIAIGGAFVLAFILIYYKLSGLVAFIAIALNILLIFGALKFIEATLTLPGIAGLVLTIGMAVDANILIYERIREELNSGKELLQAARVGFERAMVTILDANITTFIAGLVLFNVGVGPIRGFAVTLMIGIVTSVFTAFFVSRLVFHFLIERKVLTNFKAGGWFSGLQANFVAYAKPAMICSAIVIVLGIIGFVSTPTGTKLGLDFTGGAKIQVVLSESSSAQALRDKLSGSEFDQTYPSWSVNSIEDPALGGADTHFNVKIKLTPALRAEIDSARELALKEGRTFTAPYLSSLQTVLGDQLVHKAFENPRLSVNATNSARQFASIDLHFAKPVTTEGLKDALRQAYGEDPNSPNEVEPLEGAPEGVSYRVQFDVDSTMTEEMLGAQLAERLRDTLKSADGSPIALSDPIPESEEIGGRMVGELRNAAIGALLISLFLIVMFIRIRFHEYKYGIAAVVALTHDVLVTLGIVVAANAAGLVSAEINLAMIAAFLTIIGYSINDTIVIFDRVRENISIEDKLGERVEHRSLMNRSINQTLSRTILTSATTFFVVLAQFVVNYGSGSSLEGFSFALLIGILSGTYSTIFIATPVVLWLRKREGQNVASADDQAAA